MRCQHQQKKYKIVLVGEVIVEHVNHFDNYIQLLRHHQVETKMLEDYLRARQKNIYVNNKKFIVRPQVSSSINKGIVQQPAE